MTEATVNTGVPTGWPTREDDHVFTAAEVLHIALAAYQRGHDDAAVNRGRESWNQNNQITTAFREKRITDELSAMRRRAASNYRAHGYPIGYDYRGGPVDWETGLPAGSPCAWARKYRKRHLQAVA